MFSFFSRKPQDQKTTDSDERLIKKIIDCTGEIQRDTKELKKQFDWKVNPPTKQEVDSAAETIKNDFKKLNTYLNSLKETIVNKEAQVILNQLIVPFVEMRTSLKNHEYPYLKKVSNTLTKQLNEIIDQATAIANAVTKKSETIKEKISDELEKGASPKETADKIIKEVIGSSKADAKETPKKKDVSTKISSIAEALQPSSGQEPIPAKENTPDAYVAPPSPRSSAGK